MNINDIWFYVKARIINKKSCIFFLCMSLILIILFLNLTLLNYLVNYRNDMINKNVNARTLVVYSETQDYNRINGISHVIFNDSSKYLNGHYSKVKELNNNHLEASVHFLPLLDSEIYKLKNGETICPINFYPFELAQEHNNDLEEYINTKYMIKGKNIIGKELTIVSDNTNNQDIKVKVVSTYDAKKYMNSMNTCYITKEDYDLVISPYKMMGIGTDINGNEFTDYYEYDDNIIIVDNYKNVDKVAMELENMNFDVIKVFNFDENMINYFFSIPIFISIIIFIISFSLIYSFINKKIKYRLNNYGILKSCGYTNKQICLLEFIENILLLVSSFILSIILYIIVFMIIKNKFFLSDIYNNISIKIPILLIVIGFVILVLLVIIITITILNRTLKKNINLLLRND